MTNFEIRRHMQSNHAFNLHTLLYISDNLLYNNIDPNTAYPGEFLHINNQRAHNNYKNIIFKEPNENPQRAHLGPRAPLWTTLLYIILEIKYCTWKLN